MDIILTNIQPSFMTLHILNLTFVNLPFYYKQFACIKVGNPNHLYQLSDFSGILHCILFTLC